MHNLLKIIPNHKHKHPAVTGSLFGLIIQFIIFSVVLLSKIFIKYVSERSSVIEKGSLSEKAWEPVTRRINTSFGAFL